VHSIVNWLWVFGVLALLFAWYKARFVMRQDTGTDRMAEIASYIREGAIAFLKREYSVLAVFAAAVAILLFVANYQNGTQLVGVSFLVGAVCSGLAGVFGMRVATRANVRAAVMGMSVVGLGVLGLSILFVVYSNLFGTELGVMQNQVLQVLSGFSLGASSIALFARVGGGIYTKSADVGADLVGKVEAGIPEDDPRNPAVIADLVGDNVGDVCGMGADLFESYVGAIIGGMVLGLPFAASLGDVASPLNYVILPLVIAAFGILCSIAGTFVVRTKEGGNPQTALNIGTLGAAIVMLVVALPLIRWLCPEAWVGLYGSMIIGLALGIAIGFITEYYTAESKKPAQRVAEAAQTGAATNIIAGLALGMTASLSPVSGCWPRWAYSSRSMLTGPSPTTPAASPRWPGFRPKCGNGPTSWTRWAIPLPPSARASPSARRPWPPWRSWPPSGSRPTCGPRTSRSSTPWCSPGSSSAAWFRSSSPRSPWKPSARQPST
jgi:K(+)-stimulated pyrophosphate-energized sodium pump